MKLQTAGSAPIAICIMGMVVKHQDGIHIICVGVHMECEVRRCILCQQIGCSTLTGFHRDVVSIPAMQNPGVKHTQADELYQSCQALSQ